MLQDMKWQRIFKCGMTQINQLPQIFAGGCLPQSPFIVQTPPPNSYWENPSSCKYQLLWGSSKISCLCLALLLEVLPITPGRVAAPLFTFFARTVNKPRQSSIAHRSLITDWASGAPLGGKSPVRRVRGTANGKFTQTKATGLLPRSSQGGGRRRQKACKRESDRKSGLPQSLTQRHGKVPPKQQNKTAKMVLGICKLKVNAYEFAFSHWRQV